MPNAATRSADQIDRLILFRWRNGLLFMLAALTVSFFLAGFNYPYWRIADGDLFYIYNALLINDGIPQEMADHPTYLTLVALCYAIRLAHTLGLIQTVSLSTLPPVTDVAAYNQAWTGLEHILRLIALVTALGFVTAFAFLTRLLFRDWRISALATFALAFSGGVAMSARSMKSELLAAGLATCALLILLIAARTPQMKWRPLLLGLAALLSTLAIENKAQAVFVIATFPVILLPFGMQGANARWHGSRAYGLVAASGAVALLATALAAPLLHQALFDPPSNSLSLFGRLGVFQMLFGAWVATGMAAFAWLWRTPAAEAAAGAFAIIAGCAIGLVALYVLRYPVTVFAVVNPIDHLFGYGIRTNPELASCHTLGCGGVISVLARNVLEVIKNHSFVLLTSPRPAIFLEWAVIAGAVFAWRRGYRLVAAQIAVLLAAVWGVDTISASRGIKQEYFNFSDPLIVISAAALLSEVRELQASRLLFPVGAALIVLHAAFSQAEPVKHALMRSGADEKCSILNLKRLPPFPFCPPKG